MMNPAALLDIQDLSLSLRTEAGSAKVLDGVDLQVGHGEIVGLIGESGCGKSTLVRAILGIRPNGAQINSRVMLFDGLNLSTMDERTIAKSIRSRRIGFVPQDPFQAFNPLFRVGTQIFEVMRWHGSAAIRNDRHAQRRRLIAQLERVNLPNPEGSLRGYPHEFSGGQLQRLTIACAMVCEPELIIADEPTSALDVTTQQQILMLLKDLVEEKRVALLLVSHDLAVVAEFCNRVTVMYAGQSVETLPGRELSRGARHPYTRMLIDCHPDRAGALKGIPGLVPALGALPSGCRFHPRCPSCMPECSTIRPAAAEHGNDHRSRCYLFRDASVPESSRV
jgi:peptide/nickel transport system ATP-binding protein